MVRVQQEKIYVCYFRPVLLHCCETLELTVANEATLHRVERCMIQIYYIRVDSLYEKQYFRENAQRKYIFLIFRN